MSSRHHHQKTKHTQPQQEEERERDTSMTDIHHWIIPQKSFPSSYSHSIYPSSVFEQ